MLRGFVISDQHASQIQKGSLVVKFYLVQFNAITCLYKHSVDSIMMYKNIFQLASTCEDRFN